MWGVIGLLMFFYAADDLLRIMWGSLAMVLHNAHQSLSTVNVGAYRVWLMIPGAWLILGSALGNQDLLGMSKAAKYLTTVLNGTSTEERNDRCINDSATRTPPQCEYEKTQQSPTVAMLNTTQELLQETIREILSKEFGFHQRSQINASMSEPSARACAASIDDPSFYVPDDPFYDDMMDELYTMKVDRDAEVGMFASYFDSVLEKIDELEDVMGDVIANTSDMCTTPSPASSHSSRRRKGKSRIRKLKGARVTFAVPPTTIASATTTAGSDTESDTTDDIREVEAFPLLINDKALGKKKKQPPKKVVTTPIPREQQQQIASASTMEDLQQQINDMKEAMKKQKEEQQRLTEAEKELTRGDLERRWQEERYVKRFGPREDTPLTEEERSMNRQQLYRKLGQERRDRWVQRQREMGIELKQCDTCGRFERAGVEHVCLRTPVRGPLQRRGGVPVHEQLVVEGTAGGVNVRRQPVVDVERLQREHAALSKAVDELKAHKALATATPTPTDDVLMNAPPSYPSIAQVNRMSASSSSRAPNF